MAYIDSAESFAAFVADHPLAVVATSSADGLPHAALVSLAATSTGHLVFNTHKASRKVDHLAACQAVAVVIGCSGLVSLQAEGEAVVTSGVARERAVTEYLRVYPEARSGPEFAFIEIRPRWLREYNATLSPASVAEASCVWAQPD